LREWPEAGHPSDLTKNLHWFIKVTSTDTIAVIKDTQKEDKEKAIKKSWEDKEPGRIEKAKKARKKYVALQKKLEG
jgi:hypothetical protein